MLAVGDWAPDFTAEASDGRQLSLSELRGAAVVLYFFPRAFTPICTRETASFRDHHAEFEALGARIVGVSPDPLQTQCEFGSRQRVQFPLLADPERRIAAAYGVLWPLLPRVRRVTFVIDESGRVELVASNELLVSRHVDAVLEHLRRRVPAASGQR
ncbi:MAG TPA: peroxiredoxin [Polyangiaceae bacterium]|jgi:peroxiredoxin|nr:peroxiredoxin [Polyangiaceae bacterium]